MRRGFFGLVWKFNAVAIAIAALLAILVLLCALVSGNRGDFADEGKFAGPTLETRVLQFGSLTPVTGTKLIISPIGYGPSSNEEGKLPRFGDAPADDVVEIRNLIVIDQEKGTQRHVLPDNSRRIVSWELIRKDADDEKSDALGYSLMTPSKAGTGYEVIVGVFSTAAQKKIEAQVDTADRPTVFDDSQVSILFSKGERMWLSQFDLASLAKTKQVNLRLEPEK